MIYNFNFKNIKSIAIISSPLQLINFFELMINNKLDPTGVLIIINKKKYGYNNIKQIKNFYNFENQFNDLKIMICDSLKIKLINIFFIFSFKKFNFTICGNYFDNESFYFFLIKSKLKILIDDGTNTLLITQFKLNRLRKILLYFKFLTVNKIYFFTVYKKKFKQFAGLIINNYGFLKKKFSLKKKIYKKRIYILGIPFAKLKKNINDEEYYYLLKKVRTSFKEHEIFYLPHRREYSNKKFLSFIRKNKIKILYNKVPIELMLIFKSKIPSIILGFYSSALINISCFNLKTPRIINIDINKIIKSEKHNSFAKYFKLNKKIENFFI